MKNIIHHIIQKEVNDTVKSIQQIIGLGIVNQVFGVEGEKKNYIVRLNDEKAKKLEYQKENWCIHKATDLKIPSPEMLRLGVWNYVSFMIQSKVEGENGQLCTIDEKLKIWKDLGRYTAQFYQVSRIEVKAVEETEFHKNWQAKLDYSLNELRTNSSFIRDVRPLRC